MVFIYFVAVINRWLSYLMVFGCLALPTPGRADVVLEWNALMLQTFANEGGSATPPSNSRTMGMLGGAVFDAVNSVSRNYTPYLGYFEPTSTGVGIDVSAAAAAAAFAVMTTVYQDYYGPGNVFATTFNTLYTSQINAIADSEARTRGIEVGFAAAQAMIAARMGDGWNAVSSYQSQPLGTIGRWQAGNSTGAWGAGAGEFLKPQWAEMTPFTLGSASQFRPNGPDGFQPNNYTAWVQSDAYTADFNMVKDLGRNNSLTRTADETNIAYFWVDGPGTASPPGHWNRIAATVSVEQGLSLEQNARLFGLLGLTAADTGIATWEAKVFYDSWRPMYAINTANTDGNPLTIQDASWAPLIPNPSFGSYTSGHSAFSMAGATVLASYFGTDNMAFATTSESPFLPPGYERFFTSFSQAAMEAGMSRIYGGIHFMSDNVDGANLGANVGTNVYENFMQPVPEPTSALLVAVAGLVSVLVRRRV
jgi:membrane-associated phospholipid phosphatase